MMSSQQRGEARITTDGARQASIGRVFVRYEAVKLGLLRRGSKTTAVGM